MSAKLLLRLFQSKYFTVHLAVSYLRTYRDSVGITYYLAQRLAQVDEAELEFYWPQLCHLLVSHTFESGALEGLIVKKCEESIHLAMLTLWQMQASLSDLSANPSTTSFAACRRLYNRVQHIIFSDALLESTIEACHSRRKLKSHHAKPVLVGVGMALAAIAQPHLSDVHGQVAVEEGRKQGGISASEFAKKDTLDLPQSDSEDGDGTGASLGVSIAPRSAALSGRPVPISTVKGSSVASWPTESRQAKHPRSSATPSDAWPSYLPGAPLPLADPSRARSTPYARLKVDRNLPIRRTTSAASSPTHLTIASDRPLHTHSMVDLPSSGADSPQPTTVPNGFQVAHVKASRSANNVSILKPLLLDKRTRRLTSDQTPNAGLGTQQVRGAMSSLGSPRMTTSSPSLYLYSSSTQNLPQNRLEPQDHLPSETLSLLLRSYACRSQLDLITSLQDIATRLIVVPRLARLSALRAELTVLNHGLPRGCCLCLGCSGQDTGSLVSTDSRMQENRGSSMTASLRSIFSKSDTSTDRRAHHRIVRISPSESVVLNSADRAPFLIHVEILEGDLDFDPSRRQNAEDLRSVMAEREGRISKTPSSNIEPPHSAAPQAEHAGEIQTAYDTRASSYTHGTVNNEASTTLRTLSGVSEISTSNSLESPDTFTETANNGTAEEVDLVEQMYGSFSVHDAATLSTEDYHPNIHNRTVDEKAWHHADSRTSFNHRRKALDDPEQPTLANETGTSLNQRQVLRHGEPLSIDEYAERMRMAAIMLAQVNASQQAPLSGADAITGVVGAGLGMGMNLTYGVGSVVGSVVGVGMDAMKASLGSKRRPSTGITHALAGSVGQGSAGLSAPVDDSSAIAGLSNVSGVVNPTNFPEVARSAQSFGDLASPGSNPTKPLSRNLRQRLLSAQEASAIRERIMSEMMSLEDERMSRMKAATRYERAPALSSSVSGEAAEEESVVMRAVNKDDPSGSVLSESWTEKKSRIRKGSPYGHLLNWDVFSVIVKTGADLRQEQLAVQLIKEFGRIWTETGCPHWVRYFRILVTSESTGLMETITDAVSVHSIKKEAYSKMAAADAARAGYLPSFTLYDHFIGEFGQPDTPRYRKAQDAFLKSLASYSIITYLLQIKDRHNGNILIDKQGHLMHIDFGFMLSNSPGSIGFEMAPFKLSQDYVDILGGLQSSKFLEYRALLKRLFRDIRQHAERIVTLVELMQTGSKLPCFGNGAATVQQLRERFQLGMSGPQLDDHVDRLVLSSAASAFTRLYDTFQRHSQGVL